MPTESIVFAPSIDERKLSQETEQVNSELQSVGEDVPVNFDGDMDGLGGPGGDGLDGSLGGRGGGGMGGGGAAAAGAVASRIPKSVAGVTAAAAVPVALTGAVGVGMLSAMHGASARLQTSTSLLGQAWNTLWRPMGDSLDQLFVRDFAMEMVRATQNFEETWRTEGPWQAIRDATIAITSSGGELGLAINDIFNIPDGTELGQNLRAWLGLPDAGGLANDLNSWLGIPDAGELGNDLNSWLGIPDGNQVGRDLNSWLGIPDGTEVGESLRTWLGMPEIEEDSGNALQDEGSGLDRTDITNPDIRTDLYEQDVRRSDITNPTLRNDMAEGEQDRTDITNPRFRQDLDSEAAENIKDVENEIVNLQSHVQRMIREFNVTLEVDGEQIAQATSDARTHQMADTDPTT